MKLTHSYDPHTEVKTSNLDIKVEVTHITPTGNWRDVVGVVEGVEITSYIERVGREWIVPGVLGVSNSAEEAARKALIHNALRDPRVRFRTKTISKGISEVVDSMTGAKVADLVKVSFADSSETYWMMNLVQNQRRRSITTRRTSQAATTNGLVRGIDVAQVPGVMYRTRSRALMDIPPPPTPPGLM